MRFRRYLCAMIRGGVLAAVAASVALPACSLLLDFSAPIASSDAGASDATDTCADDEPNDVIAEATIVVESGTVASSLCPAGDHDFYAVTLDGTNDLVAVLRFAGAVDDLTLALYDQAGTAITVSAGASDSERIEHSAALANTLPAGTYALEVSGVDDAVKASYELDLTVGASVPQPDAGI
jgi:hypothetical protein